MTGDKKLLVIDDRVEYLDAAKKAYESCGSTFGYETATFCDSFERGIEEVRSGRYTHVLTDLFEGEETPKGLLVLMAAKEEGLAARIVTYGTRHSGKLGSIREGVRGGESRYFPELASEGRITLAKIGLTSEEIVDKIGSRELDKYLILGGMAAKSTEDDWKVIYKRFDLDLAHEHDKMDI
ncbi:MAG: hypothetical protein WCV90_01640 [Candidatus Woesearchaeota archaeon]|jgi:ActR/RegA family two-component response regulator